MRFARIAALLIAAPAAAQVRPTPYETVDPFIGTGGEGHTYPGATAPFGMVQLSADTNPGCRIRDCYPRAAGYRHDDYPGKILWSTLRLRADGTITGQRETRGWAPARKLFFAIRFSTPLTGHAFLNREEKVAYKGFQGPGRGDPSVAELAGQALVARLDFGLLDRPLEVKVAISGVDEAGAVGNLDGEPGDFDAIRAATHKAWDAALGALDIDAAPPMRTMLYTALYHSLLGPTVLGDTDGRWRGPDDAVHAAKGFTFHSTF